MGERVTQNSDVIHPVFCFDHFFYFAGKGEGLLSLKFYAKRESLFGTQWLSVKLKRGNIDECKDMRHMKRFMG